MILCLTPNPALDVTYTFDHLRPGESHRVPAPVSRAGGKGVNVARVCHAQGYPTRALITSGGATGEIFDAELRRSGIPHHAIAVAGATRQSIALVTDGGQATVLNEFGEELTPAERAQLLAAFAREAASASVTAISGSLPPKAPEGFLTELIAAAGDAPTIVDTSGPGLLEAARAGADVLKPNDIELREATGEESITAGAQVLLDLGARIVFVSLGERGLLAASGTATLHARLPRVLQGNPTGAGDAVVAGIATAIDEAGGLDRLDLEHALRRGAGWSAAAVLMPQAGEISPEHTQLSSDVNISEGLQWP